MRLTKEQSILVDKLERGKAELKYDKDSVILVEMKPYNFPCLVLKFWDKEEFLEKD